MNILENLCFYKFFKFSIRLLWCLISFKVSSHSIATNPYHHNKSVGIFNFPHNKNI